MTFPFSGLKKLTFDPPTTDIPTIPYLSWDGGEAACAWVEENAGNPAASPGGGSWGITGELREWNGGCCVLWLILDYDCW